MAGKYAGRAGSVYRALVANAKLQHRACYRCGQPIPADLTYPHPDSWSLEHVAPLSYHPELAEDPGNIRGSHLRCNQSAGNREPKPTLGLRSRDW